MAKLYWRVKKDGKWNWVAVSKTNTIDIEDYSIDNNYVLELIKTLRYVEEEE